MYAAAAAHNRSIAEFCDCDPRLIGVGMVPLDDTSRADQAAQRSVRTGPRRDLDSISSAGWSVAGVTPSMTGFWRQLEGARRTVHTTCRQQ